MIICCHRPAFHLYPVRKRSEENTLIVRTVTTKIYANRTKVYETLKRKVELESSNLVGMALCERDNERR
jgi:hypothetical protein